MAFNPDPKPTKKKKEVCAKRGCYVKVGPLEKYCGMHQTKSNKYKAVRQTYNGVSYDSTLEAKYACHLDWLLKAGEIIKWERQVSVPLEINGKLLKKWAVDFRVWFKDGRIEYHEVKGFKTEDYKLKKDLFRLLYPDEVLRIIKHVRQF